jgi:hypothetical protein
MTRSINNGRRDKAASNESHDGATTQDLRIRATAPPVTAAPEGLSATEQQLRTRGAWMGASGLVVIVMTLGIAIVWHIGFGSEMPLALMLPLYGAGFGAVYLGCMEYLSRHTRRNHVESLRRMDALESAVQRLVELLPAEMQQQFHLGQASALKDFFGARTGTDDDRRPRGAAEVLKMQRRNTRP